MPRPSDPAFPLVLLPRELGQLPPDAALVGQKAASLAELLVLKARVPRFGLVTSAAFAAHTAQGEVVRALEAARATPLADEARRVAHGEALIRAVLGAPLEDAVARAVGELVEAFSEGDLLAIRASPVGEAPERAALAGALDTLLCVRRGPEAVEAVRQCFASAFSPAVLSARWSAGLDPLATRLGVVVQRMVQSDVSGAISTLDLEAEGDPGTQMRIEATYGLSGGSSLGAGERRIVMDTYRVRRSLDPAQGAGECELLDEEIAQKQEAVRFDDDNGHGTVVRPVPSAERERPTLSALQVKALAEEALRLERDLSRPLRVVFAFAGRLLHVIEVRPLTAIRRRLTSQRTRVWDQRLLPGGLAGPTTPLTYSLVKRTSARVAHAALKALGANKRSRAARRSAAERLFGYLEGRIYANVTAFRALLELLPWHEQALSAISRGFGVPDLHEGASARETLAAGEPETAALARVGRLLRKVDADAAELLPPTRERLSALRAGDLEVDADRLLDVLDELEDILGGAATSWALLSAMCAAQYDLVLRLLRAGGLDEPSRLLNDMLGGEADPHALGLTRALGELVRMAKENPALDEILRTGSTARGALSRLLELPDARELVEKLEEAVERFGLQCLSGLKLESRALRDHPERLIELLRAARAGKTPELEALTNTALGTRKKAEYLLEGQLRPKNLFAVSSRHRVALRATARLREAIARREEVRRAVVDAVGITRAVVLALGERLFEQELLDQGGDVLFLTIEEVRGVVRGTSVDAHPRALIAARKREAARHARALSDRLETVGVVGTAKPIPKHLPGDDGRAHTLFGTPISSGEQSGRALVLRAFEEQSFGAPFASESVVVVERLDAGLLPRLVSARAVVVEGASVLDHVAVTLRGLGIPVVGGIARATAHIEPGEPLHVDGGSGKVHLVQRMPTAEAPSLDTYEPDDFARLAAPSDPEITSLRARGAADAVVDPQEAPTGAWSLPERDPSPTTGHTEAGVLPPSKEAGREVPRPATIPALAMTAHDFEATEPSFRAPPEREPDPDATTPTPPSPGLKAPPGPPPLTDPDGAAEVALDSLDSMESVDVDDDARTKGE